MYRGQSLALAVAALSMISILGQAPDATAQMYRIEETGTLGITGYGQYGVINGQSRYGLDFSNGLGVGVTLRYTVSRHVLLGLDFSNQGYDVAEAGTEFDHVSMINILGEVYYFPDHTRDAAVYFVGGFGFFRPEIHLGDENVLFPGEGFALEGGMGAEIFIRESWGFDVSARAVGYFGSGIADQEVGEVTENSTWSIGVQGRVGLFIYILR